MSPEREPRPVIELAPALTNVAWSTELVSQSLEGLFVYLSDDGAHRLRPIHAATLRLGWPPDQQPGDIVAVSRAALRVGADARAFHVVARSTRDGWC